MKIGNFQDVTEQAKAAEYYTIGQDFWFDTIKLNAKDITELQRGTLAGFKNGMPGKVNSNGIECIFRIMVFDNDGRAFEKEVAGIPIYKINKENKIIFSQGEGNIILNISDGNLKGKIICNTGQKKYYPLSEFICGENSIYISLSGDFFFESKEESIEFSRKISVQTAILCKGFIEVQMNNSKVIFTEAIAKVNGETGKYPKGQLFIAIRDQMKLPSETEDIPLQFKNILLASV